MWDSLKEQKIDRIMADYSFRARRVMVETRDVLRDIVKKPSIIVKGLLGVSLFIAPFALVKYAAHGEHLDLTGRNYSLTSKVLDHR